MRDKPTLTLDETAFRLKARRWGGLAPERYAVIPAKDRPQLDTVSADPQSRATFDAQAAWEAHVDAGRIGVPAPEPTGPGEYRCASLEAILYGRPRQ